MAQVSGWHRIMGVSKKLPKKRIDGE